MARDCTRFSLDVHNTRINLLLTCETCDYERYKKTHFEAILITSSYSHLNSSCLILNKFVPLKPNVCVQSLFPFPNKAKFMLQHRPNAVSHLRQFRARTHCCMVYMRTHDVKFLCLTITKPKDWHYVTKLRRRWSMRYESNLMLIGSCRI